MNKFYAPFQASTDQSAVDIDIPFQAGSFSSAVVHVLGIVAVMSQVVWQVFIAFIPITAISIWYQVYFVLHHLVFDDRIIRCDWIICQIYLSCVS